MGKRFIARFYDTRTLDGHIAVEDEKFGSFDEAWEACKVGIEYNGYDRADVVEMPSDYIVNPKGFPVKSIWEL